MSCCGRGHSTIQWLCPAAQELWPGAADCQLTISRRVPSKRTRSPGTTGRSAQPAPDAAPAFPAAPWPALGLVQHGVTQQLLGETEGPTDAHFNLTMSYRRDSDIFMPYGWLEPWPGQPVEAAAQHLGQDQAGGLGGVNWKKDSLQGALLQAAEATPPSGRAPGRLPHPLPYALMAKQLSQYKFYLAFENSLHPVHITEKLWKKCLQAWAVPVVLGPSRANYEQFLPPKAFITSTTSRAPRELAQYLLALDRTPPAT